MKRKAFTLAELMGVIVILGVIALLSVPIVDKVLKENSKNLYRMQLVNVEQSAANWTTDHPFTVPVSDGEVMQLTFYQLIHGGYLDQNITDPVKKTLFPHDMIVSITRKNNNFTYHVEETSGTVTTETKYNPNTPTLDLNGDTLIYLDLNTAYQELGAKSKSATDEELTTKIVIDLRGLDTAVAGTYYITYTITDHGATSVVIRTVIVKPLA